MWQIGVLTGKLCTLLLKNGSLSAFSHYKDKKKERESFQGFRRRFALLVLTPPKSG